MKQLKRVNQAGIAHLALVVLVLVVAGAIGFVGWRVMQKNSDSDNGTSQNDNTSNNASTSTSVADLKALESECIKELDDKDLCKFFATWTGDNKFTMVTTSNFSGEESVMTMTIDGDKTYMKTTGTYATEMITIGNTTYTKAGDTWWKQTNPTPTDNPAASAAEDTVVDAPTTEDLKADKTVYEKIGKEACGDKTCFKYKWTDPTATDGGVTHVWFDDEDYLIRRMRIESTDGTFSDQVYTYDNATVSEPSPVKELGPNQYIMPGQTEPVDMSAQLEGLN